MLERFTFSGGAETWDPGAIFDIGWRQCCFFFLPEEICIPKS